jgi:hypothetical protein
LVGILVSDWSISKQSSPLKLLSHPSDYREEDFFKSANQKHELPVVTMFGNGS